MKKVNAITKKLTIKNLLNFTLLFSNVTICIHDLRLSPNHLKFIHLSGEEYVYLSHQLKRRFHERIDLI